MNVKIKIISNILILIKQGPLFEQLEYYFKKETVQIVWFQLLKCEHLLVPFLCSDSKVNIFGLWTKHSLWKHWSIFFSICWHFIEIHVPKCWTVSLKMGKASHTCSYVCTLSCIFWKSHIAILVSVCFVGLWLIYINGFCYPDTLTFRLSCAFPMWALLTDATLDDATLWKMQPIGGKKYFLHSSDN